MTIPRAKGKKGWVTPSRYGDKSRTQEKENKVALKRSVPGTLGSIQRHKTTAFEEAFRQVMFQLHNDLKLPKREGKSVRLEVFQVRRQVGLSGSSRRASGAVSALR